MKVYKVYPSGFASNSYIVTDDGKNCIVIDAAQTKVYNKVRELGLNVCALLLTHAHYDHIGGAYLFEQNNIPIMCSEIEKPLIFSQGYLDIYDGTTPFSITSTFKDGDKLNLAGLDIEVIATPGHSAGSVTFKIGDSLFVGDTLFYRSVGRCDLHTGNVGEIIKSVKRLYALNGDYTVYTGHEDNTTLDDERHNNYYVRV